MPTTIGGELVGTAHPTDCASSDYLCKAGAGISFSGSLASESDDAPENQGGKGSGDAEQATAAFRAPFQKRGRTADIDRID